MDADLRRARHPGRAAQRDRALLPGLQGSRGGQGRDARVRKQGRSRGDHHGGSGASRLVTIVFGAIAPHGDPAFVEGSPTRVAFEELGARIARAEPDVTVVFTPHNVHVEGAFAVVTAATIAGSVDEPGTDLECAVDRELAAEALVSLRADGLPAVGMSYGSN